MQTPWATERYQNGIGPKRSTRTHHRVFPTRDRAAPIRAADLINENDPQSAKSKTDEAVPKRTQLKLDEEGSEWAEVLTETDKSGCKKSSTDGKGPNHTQPNAEVDRPRQEAP